MAGGKCFFCRLFFASYFSPYTRGKNAEAFFNYGELLFHTGKDFKKLIYVFAGR